MSGDFSAAFPASQTGLLVGLLSSPSRREALYSKNVQCALNQRALVLYTALQSLATVQRKRIKPEYPDFQVLFDRKKQEKKDGGGQSLLQ